MATAAKRIRVDFDETVNGLTEGCRVVDTESTAGVSNLPVLAQKSGMTPVVRVGGKRSSEEGMFYFPYGVVVDYQTGNIYVSEYSNNRVQVFDSDGRYLYKFREKLSKPGSIAISGNKVFVSQYNPNCVSVHDLNGALITQFGSFERHSSYYPTGMAINEINGDIYICNMCDEDDNKIEMFYNDLPFKSDFVESILQPPADIKLTNECIYVLSYYEPFLYSFTYDFTQTHNTAISSISKHLKCPQGFCIDGSGRFIISDCSQNAILIFNEQGELVRTITDNVSEPCGVTLDSKGRILVIGDNHSFLIF